MLRRSVELVLIVAIATLQCVSWASVDDARQLTRDARVTVDAAAHGGVGSARVTPVSLSGAVTRGIVLGPPAVSFIAVHTRALVSTRHSFTDFPLAQRPPPPAV